MCKELSIRGYITDISNLYGETPIGCGKIYMLIISTYKNNINIVFIN